MQKSQYPIDKKVKDNNINNNNIKYNKIDDLFFIIINKPYKLSYSFYSIVENLEFNYNNEILGIMKPDKIQMIKEILYVIYEIYNSNFKYIISKFERQELIDLYTYSSEHCPDNILDYYKKVLINKFA